MFLNRFNTSKKNTRINNNQLNLPDYVLKYIIDLLQHSYSTPCYVITEHQLQREHQSLFGIELSLGNESHAKFNYYSNHLYLSRVCSYWFRYIIPSTLKSFNYTLSSPSIQNQCVKIFKKNIITKYKRSPIQLFNQSLQRFINNTKDNTHHVNNNQNNNNSLQIENLKIYIPFEKRNKKDWTLPPTGISSIMDPESSLLSLAPTLRHLTLYNVEIENSILGLHQCRRLERLVIYPTGEWKSYFNDLLLELLKKTPTLTELAIKSRNTDITRSTVLDLDALTQLTKFTYVGMPSNIVTGLLCEKAFANFTCLTHLKLKFTGIDKQNLTRLPTGRLLCAIPTQTLENLRYLQLDNFINPKDEDDKPNESSPTQHHYLPHYALTHLTHLSIERLFGSYIRFQTNKLFKDIQEIKSLEYLSIKSIKFIDPQVAITTLDSLPNLTHFKYATTPKLDTLGYESDESYSNVSISLPILNYLESNHRIRKFAFILENEKGSHIFPIETNGLFLTHSNGLHKSSNYIQFEKDHLSNLIKIFREAIISLIEKSESIQHLSLSSTLGVACGPLEPPSNLVTPPFINEIIATCEKLKNSKSQLRTIKIDQCLLSREGMIHQNHSNVQFTTKKSVHAINNIWKWQMKRLIKEEVHQYRSGPNYNASTFLNDVVLL